MPGQPPRRGAGAHRRGAGAGAVVAGAAAAARLQPLQVVEVLVELGDARGLGLPLAFLGQTVLGAAGAVGGARRPCSA